MNPLSPPNQSIVLRVLKRLEMLGINIDLETASVLIAAYEDVIRHSNEGKKHLVEIFEMKWVQGQSDEIFEITDGMGRVQESVPGHDAWFLQTLVARGDFVPMRQVRRVEIEAKGCEKCGIMAHCVRSVRGESSCNHCLLGDDLLRNEGDPMKCRECTKVLCEYHPSRDSRCTA